MSTVAPTSTNARLSSDFWKFFIGQTLSNLGSSFTNFALPLIVYKLTGSALNLAITSAAVFLPYLLFGLVIGAWVDRLDRKRVMIIVDSINTIIIVSIPILAYVGLLSIGYIYVVGFVASTAGIFFQSSEFAAIPNLVKQNDLVTANGRIQASYSIMQFAGPIIAGALVFLIPVETLLFIDATSFLVSVISLLLVRVSFNPPPSEEPKAPTSLGQDIMEGLRYVLGHPVLRMISLMMALVNFFGSTIGFEMVYFSKKQLAVQDWQYGFIVAAGPIGVAVLSLLAGPLHKRFKFSRVALTALALDGLFTIALGLTVNIWVAIVLIALSTGLGILFNINTGSLRQAIVPNHMLGRVMTIAGVLAWSAIPVGTIIGGIAIDRTQGTTLSLGALGTIQNIGIIFAIIGGVTFIMPLLFALTSLGHAEKYLPKDVPPESIPLETVEEIRREEPAIPQVLPL